MKSRPPPLPRRCSARSRASAPWRFPPPVRRCRSSSPRSTERGPAPDPSRPSRSDRSRIDQAAGTVYVRDRGPGGSYGGGSYPGFIDRFDLDGNPTKYPGTNSTSLPVPVGYFGGPGNNPDRLSVDNTGSATQGNFYLNSEQIGTYGFDSSGILLNSELPGQPIRILRGRGGAGRLDLDQRILRDDPVHGRRGRRRASTVSGRRLPRAPSTADGNAYVYSLFNAPDQIRRLERARLARRDRGHRGRHRDRRRPDDQRRLGRPQRRRHGLPVLEPARPERPVRNADRPPGRQRHRLRRRRATSTWPRPGSPATRRAPRSTSSTASPSRRRSSRGSRRAKCARPAPTSTPRSSPPARTPRSTSSTAPTPPTGTCFPRSTSATRRLRSDRAFRSKA